MSREPGVGSRDSKRQAFLTPDSRLRSKEATYKREQAVTVQKIETEFAGRPLVLETGRMAKLAAGSAVLRFGDTVVLAAVTVSPNVSTLPFFPLTVEYREKTYAAGKIPGGFLKREGRPSDKEILASRLIDRSIRPLFPEGSRTRSRSSSRFSRPTRRTMRTSSASSRPPRH